MLMDSIAIPTADVSAAEEFERKADDFAALAEAAATAEECIRYRDLEHGWRMRAAAERAREFAHLYVPESAARAAT